MLPHLPISHFLWLSYVVEQAIIFFALWFLLSSSIYLLLSFHCLISVVADWMSTILLHMV